MCEMMKYDFLALSLSLPTLICVNHFTNKRRVNQALFNNSMFWNVIWSIEQNSVYCFIEQKKKLQNSLQFFFLSSHTCRVLVHALHHHQPTKYKKLAYVCRSCNHQISPLCKFLPSKTKNHPGSLAVSHPTPYSSLIRK